MFTKTSATLVAMLMAIIAAVPAFAQGEKTIDKCDSKYLDEMARDLNVVEALVPNVPPEEVSYLEKEYPAALHSQSDKRFYDVQHRPLFTAWNLHKEVDRARSDLKSSRRLQSLRFLRFKIQQASGLPFAMQNVKIAWDEFASAAGGKLLTNEQIERGGDLSRRLVVKVGYYIHCLANFIPEAH